MKTCWVEVDERRYPIYIGADLLSDKALLTSCLPQEQVMIVTNQTLADLYLAPLKEQLKDKQCNVTVLPEGEVYKNLPTLSLIFDELLRHHHHRGTQIIALGGGVIGDMAGFAASCYQRGVSFVQIPTTLLAQVDSSVGGKTGVNHALGKNMIGAFYQPRAVIIDTNTLKSLSAREFSAGLAEVVKYGLIYDVDFFNWLEKNIHKVIAKEAEALHTIIHRCCQIKAEIVAKDEREQGIRAILNFGHTFGHAFELGLGYGQLLHGEAVAAGMMVAMQLSVALGFLSAKQMKRAEELLTLCQLPTHAPAVLSVQTCLELMSMDKKVQKGEMRFILLNSIGDAFVHNAVPKAQIIASLKACGLSKES